MPTIRRSTLNLIAGLVALSMIAALVIRTSSAVFTAETNNTGNSLEAGTIVLTDNAATALFTVENIAPGEYSQRCIQVDYDGTLDPERVKVYSTSAFATTPGLNPSAADMQDWVNITVEEVSGSGACSSLTSLNTIVGGGPGSSTPTTLADWHSTANSYTTGDGIWNPSGPGESQMYRVTLELDLDTGNTYQGAKLAGIALTWWTRSTASPGLKS